MERAGERPACDRSGAVDACGAGVLELLLGAEEGIEHGLARVLAEDQSDDGADDRQHHQPAETTLLTLLRRPQGFGSVAQVLRRRLEVALYLLVAGHGLDGAAVAGRTAVGAPRCLES